PPRPSRTSHHVFFLRYGCHRDLHSFPTRRSSDLVRRVAPRTPVRPERRAEARRDPVLRAGRLRPLPPGARALRRRVPRGRHAAGDRKSTRLNSSHVATSYAVFCLKKKKTTVP